LSTGTSQQARQHLRVPLRDLLLVEGAAAAARDPVRDRRASRRRRRMGSPGPLPSTPMTWSREARLWRAPSAVPGRASVRFW